MPEVHAFPSIPTRILLPIDFSPSSRGFEMAADLAGHFTPNLYLVQRDPRCFPPRPSRPRSEGEFMQETEIFCGASIWRSVMRFSRPRE